MAERSERRCFFSLELNADLVWQFFYGFFSKIVPDAGKVGEGEEICGGESCWSDMKFLIVS